MENTTHGTIHPFFEPEWRAAASPPRFIYLFFPFSLDICADEWCACAPRRADGDLTPNPGAAAARSPFPSKRRLSYRTHSSPASVRFLVCIGECKDSDRTFEGGRKRRRGGGGGSAPALYARSSAPLGLHRSCPMCSFDTVNGPSLLPTGVWTGAVCIRARALRRAPLSHFSGVKMHVRQQQPAAAQGAACAVGAPSF